MQFTKATSRRIRKQNSSKMCNISTKKSIHIMEKKNQRTCKWIKEQN